MRLSTTFVLSSLLLCASASPVERRRQTTRISLAKRGGFAAKDGSASPEALRAHLSRRLAHYEAGFSAYERNTGKRHPLAGEQPLEKRTSSVPLRGVDDNIWIGKVSVGSPAKPYTVDFDTGSSDFFLPGTLCAENCQSHTRYDPKESTTSKNLHKPFSVSYGDGSRVTGEQYTDTVAINGYTAEDVVLGVGAVYSDGLDNSVFPADGVLGMGFKSISFDGAEPFFAQLIQQDGVEDPVFAFRLDLASPELTLGGVNEDLYEGDITFIPVTEEGYWQVDVDALAIGNKTIAQRFPAIIDTGTTMIIGSKTDVDAFYAAVPDSKDASEEVGPGYYSFPCNATLEDMNFTFGGRQFSVTKGHFRREALSSDSSRCVGGVVADEKQEFWIVGDVFLSGVYSVFDMGKKEVGFASLKEMEGTASDGYDE
ncbi:acid protease [Trametes meyenii]|nr:acid protease [Trametes meyenii]